MTDLKIEHGLPIPTNPRRNIFPWPQMQPGDSFVVEGDDVMRSARASFQHFRKRQIETNNLLYGMTSRKIGPNSYRLWLTGHPANE